MEEMHRARYREEAFVNVREFISIVGSHPVYGNFVIAALGKEYRQ